MKSLIKNKKGILGLDTARAVILALLTLAIIGIATMLALNSMVTTSIFGGATTAYNNSANLMANVSYGVNQFFTNAGTWFTLLAVVVIILIISIVIVAVSRFGGTAEGGGGGM